MSQQTRARDAELQFGINHLGHFALAGLLIDRLAALPGARVVTVSSNNHSGGQINFDDLQSERGYRRMAGYSQSKLANLMFTYELQRRLHAAGSPAIASHDEGAQRRLWQESERLTGIGYAI